jgi:glucose/arabinose dehydrogenase
MKPYRYIALMVLFSLMFAACRSIGENQVFQPVATLDQETVLPTDSVSTDPTPQDATQEQEEMYLPKIIKSPEDADTVTEFPDPGLYTWRSIRSGLTNPVGLENASDGTGRLFVIEQRGVIRIIQNGEFLSPAFLDISGRVQSTASEQGLLGLAFHPHYSENGYFYVNYTQSNGDTSISRFQVTSDPNQADAGSETQLLHIPQPFGNHNGGVIKFGPDGYLYLGLGDGGSGGDPQGNGQSLGTLLGKVLRIDVDGGQPYAIPPDNPFTDGGGLPEIWAFGLRNPWRFSFDLQTSDLYIADVGQSSFEEVNFQPATSAGGENYGWNIMEGIECFSGGTCDTTGLTLPVHTYPTREQGNCSITGGYVYRGENLPDWLGVYVFGDYCSGRIWGMLPDGNGGWKVEQLYNSSARISSFGLDEGGELYLVDHNGSIFRLEAE